MILQLEFKFVYIAWPMSCGFHAEKVVGLESLRSNILVRPGSDLRLVSFGF